MGNRQNYLVKNICHICQKMDQKGFVANHDGNVSVRYEDYLLATPTAEAKANITEEMIITLDMKGKKVSGIGNPFSEIKLHLAAYQARPEINAVVHAHPPFASARGLVGLPLDVSYPEAVVSIGDKILVAPFAMPGAPANDGIIFEMLSQTDVFLLPGNGVLAVGADLEQAYLRLELVEHLIKIDYYARSFGTPMSLSAADVNGLLEKRKALGLGPKNLVKKNVVTAAVPQDDLKKIIAEELRKILS